MDGARLGLHDAAIGIDLRAFLRTAAGFPGEPHAGLLQPLDRAGECRPDGRRPDFPAGNPARYRDEDRPAGRARRLEFLAGHDRIGFGAIGDTARQRPDGIERGAQRKCALGRDALAARLETDDAAERRRDAHRTAGVAADRDLAHAVGRGDRRASRRSARHPRAVARIARRAEMRIGADRAKANSVMLVLATMTAPPARRRRTTERRPSAGGASSARIFEPARVGSPATSNRSLMLTMVPSSGPRETPCAARASAASAAARAVSA